MWQGRPVYNSAKSFLEETASRERFKSSNFMELALDYATTDSNRVSSKRLNRIRHESKGISPTTFRNLIEREGELIQKHIDQKCDEELSNRGFVYNGEVYENKGIILNPERHIEQAIIEDASISLNIENYNASDYESPDNTVNVSIDEVCVKRQTEMRPKDEERQQAKRVENTVLHIQHRDRAYILNATSIMSGLKLLIGMLLFNGLLSKQIVIFADGARTIHGAVFKMLHFANIKIILDWYHLQKKCKEQLSMALKGSKIRNEFLEDLMPCLWFGNVKGAIKLLQNIEPNKIKNQDYIRILVEYLNRVCDYIPCYALRKELGLRNSSNLGEKANDIVVSNRQKYNGMSWSNNGSSSFATIASASYNQETLRWIHCHEVSFEMRPAA